MTEMVEPGIYSLVTAVLFWAAVTDLKERRIPNAQPLGIVCLFLALAGWQLLTGLAPTTALAWPLLSGILVFSFCLVLFALGLMGGGDVKLMAAVALIAGPSLSASFVLLVAVMGGFVALGTLVHAMSQSTHEPSTSTLRAVKVPYGVAIMVAGWWVCFQKIAVSSA